MYQNCEKGSTISDSWALLEISSSFSIVTFLTINLCSNWTAKEQSKNLLGELVVGPYGVGLVIANFWKCWFGFKKF